MSHGYNVKRFSVISFFSSLLGKLQYRFPIFSPASYQLNHAIRQTAKKFQPDVVLIWRGIHVFPETYTYFKTELKSVVVILGEGNPYLTYHFYFADEDFISLC